MSKLEPESQAGDHPTDCAANPSDPKDPPASNHPAVETAARNPRAHGNSLKYCIAGGLLAAWLAFSLVHFYRFWELDSTMEKGLLTSEARKMATELFFKKLETIGQTSLALIGALWGLAFLSDKQALQLKDGLQWMLFCLTNLSFLVSYGAYFIGYDKWVARMFNHESFDLRCDLVSFWTNTQTVYFGTGVIGLVLTVLVGRKK